MSDLSSYTPIYIRKNGTDNFPGGSGTITHPYLTAARGFRKAYFEGGTSESSTPQVVSFTGISLSNGYTIAFNCWDEAASSYNTVSVDATTSGATTDCELAEALVNLINADPNFYGTASYSCTGPAPEVTITSPTQCGDSDNGQNWYKDYSGDAFIPPVAESVFNLILATPGTGLFVLDFGTGNFGGVNLREIYITDCATYSGSWPSRIAVRGSGSSLSNLGGVDGQGIPGTTDGFSINIISDLSINLGDINSGGANGNTDPTTISPTAGNNITLTDCVCNNISSTAGYNVSPGYWAENVSDNGGNIVLNNVTCNNIDANGADGLSDGTVFGSSAGNITITSGTITGYINAKGGDDSYSYGNGGSITINNAVVSQSGTINVGPIYGPGSVTISGSTIIPNLIIGASSVNTSGVRKGRGVNGSNILGLI